MNRRDFLARTGLGALAAAGATGQAATEEREKVQPNIILIMTDDLGYGHLGCYGQEIIETPHLDQLAHEGVRFTQSYAGCAVCAPSRSVLMTGYHAGHTPVRGNSGGIPLRREDVTMAEMLRQAGYTTALFGKWGLGDARTSGAPNRQGFDEFFGYLHQKHAHFAYTDYLWHNEHQYPLEGNRGGRREQYSHDVIMEKALDFIRERDEQPFFCFLSLTIPHHEWTAPAEAMKQYSGRFEEHPPEFRWREGYACPDEPKATLAAMISHMDRGVGQLMALLDEKGIREKTLVVFSSDNGADSYSIPSPEFFKANGPLRGYKGDLYEGGIRIPTIANWPGHIPQGATSDHVWYFADLMPTFAELAGDEGTMPSDVDGISILPALIGEDTAGRAQEQHELLYWEEGGARAGRMGDWKAVAPRAGAPLELYDLGVDLGEKNNVAAQHPDIVARMAALLEENHVDAPPQIAPDTPDGRYYR